MTETETGTEADTTGAGEGDPLADVPDWDDEYVDRVSDRLLANFDLEKDLSVAGERFTLYGEMRIVSQKHFFHPALSYAEHETTEHLFVRRAERVSVTDLERLVEVGHDLAEDWIDADEEHFSTRFSFAVVTAEIPAAVREFVAGFRERTLLKYGYHGDYEVNLVVAAPEQESVVGSEEADVATAFRVWQEGDGNEGEHKSGGLLARLFG